MKLIDADKLLENYKKWIPQLSSKEDEGDRRGVETCIAVLEDTPAVDAVSVVRCRECIHYEMGVCLKIYDDGAASSYAWQGRKPDHFCSYGERKEGDD